MMRRFVASLLLLLTACIATPAANGANCSPCAVNAVFRPQIHVSNVSYGGIPVGNDSTGDGSLATPYLTIDKAQQQVVPGAQIMLNGDPLAPSTYIVTSLVVGTYTIQAETGRAYGAKVAGTGTTQAILAILDNHLTLADVWLDPSQNTSGPGAAGIIVPTNLQAASRMSITLTRVKCTGWTTYCLNANGTTRAQITITDSIFTGGQVDGAIFVSTMASGSSFSRTGGSCTLTAQKTTTVGGCTVAIGASGTTATASISGVTDNMTLDSTLVGAGTHYVTRFHDLPGATISSSTFNCLGAPGTRTCALAYISHTSNDISGASIAHITGSNQTNGGYGCGTGNESYNGASPSVTVNITDCNVTGNSTSGNGGLHCIFMGANTQNGTADGGTLTSCGIPLVNKLGSGNTFKNFTIAGWYGTALLVKGATNAAMTDNAATQTIAVSGGVGWYVEDDDGGVHSTGATLARNSITNSGGTSFTYGKLDPSNTFTAANDNYTFTSGTNATNVFTIAGSNYTTCAAYAAANEPTATCVGF